jgi:predicted site-specific integrase-resolvase
MYRHEAVEFLGITFSKFRRLVNNGVIRYTEMPGNRRIYFDEDIYRVAGKQKNPGSWCVLYCRVGGVGARAESLLHEQKLSCTRWATENGYSFDRIYEELAPSQDWELERRPAFYELLKDCREGRVATVVVETPCRLSRWHMPLIMNMLDAWNVQLFVINRLVTQPEYLKEQVEELVWFTEEAKRQRENGWSPRAMLQPKKRRDRGRVLFAKPNPKIEKPEDPLLGDLM